MNDIIDKLALIHIVEKKILMARSMGKDVFYMPGGKRESQESDRQALQREIQEELGVDLIPETLEYVGAFTAQAHGKQEGVLVRATCYRGQFKGELKASGEITEISWLSYKDRDRIGGVGHVIFDWLKEQNLLE